MHAVDGLRENSCGAGLAYSAGAAEKIGMGQLAAENGILQRPGYVVLSDKGFKGIRTVLACRYYILTHRITKIIK